MFFPCQCPPYESSRRPLVALATNSSLVIYLFFKEVAVPDVLKRIQFVAIAETGDGMFKLKRMEDIQNIPPRINPFVKSLIVRLMTYRMSLQRDYQ